MNILILFRQPSLLVTRELGPETQPAPAVFIRKRGRITVLRPVPAPSLRGAGSAIQTHFLNRL